MLVLRLSIIVVTTTKPGHFMSASTRKYMSKRQTPCDFCRSRKTACRIEGHLPCRLCALHGKQCTFLEAAQPRKRPITGDEMADSSPARIHTTGISQSNCGASAPGPGPSPPMALATHSHEMTEIGPQLTFHSGSPHEAEFDLLANHFLNEIGEVPFDVHDTRMYLDDGLSPQALFTDRNMQRSPNLLTTPAKPGIDADRSQNPQILGYSGDMDPYLLQHYQFDASGSFRFKQLTIQSASSGSIPIQFLLSQPELLSFSRQEMGLLQAPYSVAREELETLVSVDTGARLISLFRRFILPQYPIFSDSDPPAPQTSPPHLLAALYMVAQPFARFDDVLSIELAYEGLDNKALFNFITQSLLYESHDPNLSDAQTLILLTLRPSTNPLILESSFKWSLHGQLVSTSHSLGLHYDPSTWNIAPWQVALRRRLSCTVFALDKWLACSLGRPPLLARDAWLVTQVTNADSHMSGLSVDAWNNYTCIAQLGLLLGDVLGRL